MNLTFDTFLPLLSLGIISITTVVVMLAIAFFRHHWWNATLTVVGLNIALISTIYLAIEQKTGAVTSLLIVDQYAYFYSIVILVAALACCTLTHAFMESYKNNKEEIYLLLLLATAGALVLVYSHHMASFFIGLELLSVPVYGMVAYTHERGRSLEAGIKYFAEFGGGVIVFGTVPTTCFECVRRCYVSYPAILCASSGFCTVTRSLRSL